MGLSNFSKINLHKAFEKVTRYFSPKIIGEIDDNFVKIAKIKGQDVPWHNHQNEDEFFHVIKGSLLFELENQASFYLDEGEMFVVKKGINHRVSAENECWIMLIEKKQTQHTGDVDSSISKSIEQQQY